MKYAIGIQMEFSEKADFYSSTTFLLAREAEERGHVVMQFSPDSVSYYNGEVFAWSRQFKTNAENKIILGEPQRINLRDLDVVLMRQDQPYNLKYLTNCHLLEKIHPRTFVVNDPRHVRKAADKWFVTKFPEITPPTLISCDKREIKAFRDEHKDIMLKPLYSRHGEGKYHMNPDSENFDSYIEMFLSLYGQMIIAQKYIKRVDNCDRRVIMIDGKAVGAYDRIAAPFESRATIETGAIPTKAEMTKRDFEICEIIAPTLKELGIMMAAVDIIGDYMIEIDVNSPTGLGYINRFDGINSAAIFWQAIEERLA